MKENNLLKKILPIILIIVIVIGILLGIHFGKNQDTSNEETDSQVGKIIFSVQDQEYNPVVGQSYCLKHVDGDEIGTVATGTDGVITYYNVPVGDYIIESVQEDDDNNDDTEESEILSTTVTVEAGQTSYANITTNVLYGTLTIRVVDDLAATVTNATFNIYDKDGYVIDTFQTDDEGKIVVSYTYGTYYFKQTDVEGSYDIDETLYTFTISEENYTFYATITNECYKGTLLLVVTDENGEAASEITYLIYDENKNVISSLTTNSKGLAGLKTIPAGTYYYKEENADESSYTEFVIEEDGQIVRQDITVSNQ